jgi:hypothetical protein
MTEQTLKTQSKQNVTACLLATTACLSFIFGCASAELKPGAEKIKIVEQAPSGCQSLGDLSAQAVSESKSREALDAEARIGLRNKGLSMGANTLHLTQTQDKSAPNLTGHLTHTHILSAKGYLCK